MSEYQAGRKAIAKESGMHNFKDGSEITFVNTISNIYGHDVVFNFEGVVDEDGTIEAQHLIASEFEWLEDGAE